MARTVITCSKCGQLGFWGYDRDIEPLRIFKEAHQDKHGEEHKVKWWVEGGD